MDLIISKNGYSDYKRKTIDEGEVKTEEILKEKPQKPSPFKSHL